ncbi:MAG: hypothetical protein J1E61_04400 [Lachnospiraceae bacterium]|nr:hypothetical protein [Lachnospiraceae bacterium]
MKFKKSDINILIGLLGIVLAACSYFFVYQNFTAKTDELKVENTALQAEVDELQKMADNKAFYESETARMEEEIHEIMSHFPGEIRTEDQIMYAVNLENIYDIWVNNLSMEGTQLVQVAVDAPQMPTNDAVVEDTGDAANDAIVATGGLRDTVFLYTSPFTLTYKATYHSAKEVLYDILQADDRMDIKAITLAFDGETGALAGTVDATMYTMSGTDYIYTSPQINGVRTGTADFFRAANTLVIDATPGGSAEGEEGEAAEGEAAE